MSSGSPLLRSGEPLVPSNNCSTMRGLLSSTPIAHCTATHRSYHSRTIPCSSRERDAGQIGADLDEAILKRSVVGLRIRGERTHQPPSW
jgi:hypothetical protein